MSNLKDKRILVTGGAGFIGSEVVSQLVKKNAKVTVLDNFSSGKKEYLPKNNKNLRIIKGDITDEKIVTRSVKDQESVIHLAALPFIPDSFYYPADFFNVNISDQEVDDSLSQLDDLDTFKNMAEEEFGIDFEEYKRFVAKPSILEAKVYETLIDNYNDREGIQTAQSAYDSLVKGDDFIKVAKNYASDMTFIDNSIWLTEEELIGMYEPIKTLIVGGFSKIVNTPGAYIIWKLESKNQEENKNTYEVKSIVIMAKTLQSFLDDYLSFAEIEKIY